MDEIMEAGQTLKLTCNTCGNVGFADGADGYYYCKNCGSQAEDVIETGVADEDFAATGAGTGTALYRASHTRHVAKSQSTSQFVPLSQQSSFWTPLFQEPNTITKDGEDSRDCDYSGIYKVKKEEVHYDYGIGPTEPNDFSNDLVQEENQAGYEDYHQEVRKRYLMGMQLMIELQCEALVKKFKVSPVICGVAGNIWLRFVSSTGVLHEDWADTAINESESQKQGEPEDFRPRAKYRLEPHNLNGQRAVMIWCRLLRQQIPLSTSLAISFLICHVAREAVLPTDIVKWSLEGKLPYFAAFVDIEKRLGKSSLACPISASVMFRPFQVIPVQKMESMAASIADTIGLHLPPVNFCAISSRFLKILSLPSEKILPCAMKIQEWSMPPELWLSTNGLRLPTRVYIMSVVIVAIRILYNINGFGAWERSLLSRLNISSSTGNNGGRLVADCDSIMGEDTEKVSDSPFHSIDNQGANINKTSLIFQEFELDAEELLYNLEARYDDMKDTYEHSKDLSTYLQYCKDVVFAGMETPHDDYEEARNIEEFWNFYQNAKEPEHEPAEHVGTKCPHAPSQKRVRDDGGCHGSHSKENKKGRVDGCNDHEAVVGDDCLREGTDSETKDKSSSETTKGIAIRRLKMDMEENRFCYIPPRIKLKRLDYLHYVRKKDEGSLIYVAHADYYILLRACARVAQVDVRNLHIGVLNLERRLAWLENRIDHCVNLTPPSFTCEFCSDVGDNPEGRDPDSNEHEHSGDDSIGLSNLNI